MQLNERRKSSEKIVLPGKHLDENCVIMYRVNDVILIGSRMLKKQKIHGKVKCIANTDKTKTIWEHMPS